ncbi:MAG: hypothetical protein WAT58_08000 [Candidatus Dormiibacterota bacterium]
MRRGPVNFLRQAARLVAAAGWRQWWHLDDVVRGGLYGNRQAFESRPREEMVSSRVARVQPAPRQGAEASSARLALLPQDSRSDSGAAGAARYYGLHVADPTAPLAGDGRPLLGLSLEGLASLPDDWLALVRRQLSGGGTVLVNGVTTPEPLRALLASLEVDGEVSDRPAQVSTVTFAPNRPDFGAELAGLSFETSTEALVLSGPSNAEVLAYGNGKSAAAALAIELPIGEGRLVVGSGSQRLRTSLSGAFDPEQALAILPAMMLMRREYGRRAWHAPMALADLVIDDPVLQEHRLGMDYPAVLAATASANLHLTVATVPRELSLAEPEVVGLLAQHPDVVSVCYHGNDHAGYEFYRSSSGGKRHVNRSLDHQRRAIRSAADRGRAFQRRTGYSLDRVMVFPHGLGPADLLPSLAEAGFLATCNWLDRYPLESAVPDDYDLGLRPADLAWGGFPLLWRRRPRDDAGFALDLFLGRPAIAFGHRKNLRAVPDWPAELAERVNTLGVARPVVWRGLEEIARHAYQQRLEGTEWGALMTANEICLHNPDDEPRVYRVRRPQPPAGATLESGSLSVAATDGLVVTVLPGARAVVRLVIPGGSELPRPGGPTPTCTLPD